MELRSILLRKKINSRVRNGLVKKLEDRNKQIHDLLYTQCNPPSCIDSAEPGSVCLFYSAWCLCLKMGSIERFVLLCASMCLVGRLSSFWIQSASCLVCFDKLKVWRS